MASVTSVPVVSRREILRVVDPMLRGSERARFQTLRDKRVVSAGVRRHVAGNSGRLSGSVHLFSVLNRDSARLYRLGRLQQARDVATEAGELESSIEFARLADALVAHAAQHSEAIRLLADAPWKVARALVAADDSARQALVSASVAANAMRDVNQQLLENVSRIAGWVRAIESNMAFIQTAAGYIATLPVHQLETVGLARLGTPVEVEWEDVDPGEVIVSTTAALDAGPEDKSLTSIFTPPPVLNVSSERWASLKRRLQGAPQAIPSIPIPLPR